MNKSDLSKIIEVGLLLSSERNLEKLFDKILRTSREVANADAGSLYIKKAHQLEFISSQNETLEKRFKIDGNRLFKPFPLALTRENIAGYVCLTGEILKIKDVYHLPKDTPYSFFKSFDNRFEYRSKSMLVLPLTDRDGHVIGVLQLINAKDENGETVSFHDNAVKALSTLASFAAISLKNAMLSQNVKDAHLSTIYRLVNAAEYRDPDTAYHLERMSNYSRIIAEQLGYDDEFLEVLLYASPMHDIGKLGTPDRILLKPGRLTVDERSIMEKHTIIGADILKNPDNDLISMGRSIAMTHHERWDGKGYPEGIKGEEIPIEGRISALADVFDALSVKRVYKEAWPLEKVVALIKEERGQQFCPYVVDAFFKGYEEIQKVYSKFKE